MKKRAEEILVTVVIIGAFLLMFSALLEGYRYATSIDNDDKKKVFLHNEQEFVCRGGYEKFLVSKKGGWNMQGDEFIKDGKIVPISECTER